MKSSNENNTPNLNMVKNYYQQLKACHTDNKNLNISIKFLIRNERYIIYHSENSEVHLIKINSILKTILDFVNRPLYDHSQNIIEKLIYNSVIDKDVYSDKIYDRFNELSNTLDAIAKFDEQYKLLWKNKIDYKKIKDIYNNSYVIYLYQSDLFYEQHFDCKRFTESLSVFNQTLKDINDIYISG